MKHLLLIASFLTLTISNITAQESKQKENKKTTFGTVLGLNLHTSLKLTGVTSSNSNNSYSENIKYYGGFFVNRKLSERFNLQFEALYLSGVHNDFIETPIMFNYSLNKKFEVYLGGQVNYMLVSKNEVFNRLGFALNIGLRYDISKKWFIDARYIHRFSELKQSFINSSNYQKSFSSFRLGIGYRF